MGIPAFTELGLLPHGVHNCEITDVATTLCWNAHRTSLWERFQSFLDWYNAQDIGGILHVDGSFVTDKAIPGDIDVLVDLSGLPPEKQIAGLRCFSSQRDNIKHTFGVDFWIQLPGVVANDFVDFFQYIGAKTGAAKGVAAKDRKGILRIAP